MKTLKPTDIIHFGKNSGLSLAAIYKYQPSYIEWAILNLHTFKIDIDEFEKLPTPTTIGYVTENFLDKNNLSSNDDIFELLSKTDMLNFRSAVNVHLIKQLIQDGEKTDDLKEFRFSEKIRQINNNKF